MKYKRILWWSITSIYLGLTYATLGMMPSYWNRLNELLSGNGLLFQYVLYAAIGVGLTLFLYRKGFFNQAKNVLVTLFFVVAFCVMFYLEKNPGEKIHMFQYGIFGWLLFKALALDSKNTSVHLYLTGGLICLIAGALDEVIQGILPNRYFTWHDVFINGISGIMVQLYMYFYLKHRVIDARRGKHGHLNIS